MSETNRISKTTRSVLYYPTIKIPSGEWLNQSLLYWDEVCSIVPHDPEATRRMNSIKDLRFLQENHAYRRINPDSIISNADISREFKEEFVQTLDSPKFKDALSPKDKREFNSTIHILKMGEEIVELLAERGLTPDRIERLGHRKWVLVEDTTASFFMGLLAKYLGFVNRATPSTNRIKIMRSIFAPLSEEDKRIAVQISLRNILPVPRSGTDVKKILEFKQKRGQELLHFSTIIDEINEQLQKCSNQEEIDDVAERSKKQIDLGKSTLETTLQEEGIPTKTGSMSLVFSIAGSAISNWITSATTPEYAPISTGAFLGGAFFQVGHFWVSQEFNRNRTLRNSPYSYCYHASREKII